MKHVFLKNLFPVYILVAFLLMSVGYASISSSSSEVTGTIYASAQEGLFITSVSYVSDNNANVDDSSNDYFSTLLYSNIVLSETDATSSITYEITIYNNTSESYSFTEVVIDEAGDFYSNYGIVYVLDGLEATQEVKAYSSVTFNITFYYKDGALQESNTLEGYLNFNFEYTDNYCAVNGVTALNKCLVSNDSKEDYNTALVTIAKKDVPDYSSIAPSSEYQQKISNGTISTSSNYVYVGTGYDFDTSTGKYTLTGTKAVYIREGELDLDDGNTYYTINSTATSSYTMYEIKSIASNGLTMVVVTYTQSVANSSGVSGLFATSDYDGETTYYYRGEVENNWVSFGGFLWRIIRINSDGSIRMIYSGIEENSSHTGSYSLIRNSSNSISSTYSATSLDGTAYKYGATYTGYMYNPKMVLTSTPSYSLSAEGGTYDLSKFPAYSGITSSTNYYFFNDFELENNCSTDSEKCTLVCTNYDSDTEVGDNCVSATWGEMATSDNYTTDTSYGSTATYYYYTNDYKYTCFGIGDSEVSEDGTVTVSCSIVSEILGVVQNSSTQAKVRYHGLFSASYEDAVSNVSNSNVKYEIDYWYENNILDKEDDDSNLLSDYLADEIFCSDRSYYSGNGYNFDINENIKYNSYYRISSQYAPSLTCSNSEDRFTVSTDNGNGALTYPIALITIDEASLAGGVFGQINYKYYLQSETWYWTMSPAYFNANNLDARVSIINSSGNLTVNSPSSTLGIRPVINLTSSVLYVGGTGTEDDPYVVGLASEEG